MGVFKNRISEGYEYDMNSQFSNAMMEEMPVGNPIFTTERDLNKLFGFVFGSITPPSKDVLKVPYIQCREEDGTVTTPAFEDKKSFDRWIYSEEIKAALKDGYTINIICAYKFNKGVNVFKKYVDTFYNMKSNATNEVDRQIAKLMLNSLYGRFGMRDIYSTIKIVNSDTAAQQRESWKIITSQSFLNLVTIKF